MPRLKGEIPKQIKEDLKSGKLNPNIGTYPATCDKVSIDTPAAAGFRDVKAKRIADNLRDVGGFDWRLFGLPLVARSLATGKLYVYDGNHRVETLKVAQPGLKVFPCAIIDFEDEVEINNAFWRINGGNSSEVTAEERWVNQFLGRMIPALYLANNVLIKSNVVIWGGKNCYGPTSIKNPKWFTRLGPVRDVLSRKAYWGFYDKDSIANAIWGFKTYQRMFSTRAGVSEPTNIIGQLYKALVAIKSMPEYQEFFKDNLDVFEEWLTARAMTDTSPKDDWLFQDNKHDRMECRHLGTALGIVKKFRGALSNNGALKTKGKGKFLVQPILDAFQKHDIRKAEQEAKKKKEKEAVKKAA